MDPALNIIVTIVCSVLASSGLWAYLQKRMDKKKDVDEDRKAERDMLVGLAHDRIVYLGMIYIERGYITQDEYENLDVYLYKPYSKLGGNGSASRIMEEVDHLPMRASIHDIRKGGDNAGPYA